MPVATAEPVAVGVCVCGPVAKDWASRLELFVSMETSETGMLTVGTNVALPPEPGTLAACALSGESPNTPGSGGDPGDASVRLDAEDATADFDADERQVAAGGGIAIG